MGRSPTQWTRLRLPSEAAAAPPRAGGACSCEVPGCAEQIRALAPAIAFCMAPANNLFAIRSMVGTTNQAACQLAANVFGRDEQSKLEFSGASCPVPRDLGPEINDEMAQALALPTELCLTAHATWQLAVDQRTDCVAAAASCVQLRASQNRSSWSVELLCSCAPTFGLLPAW